MKRIQIYCRGEKLFVCPSSQTTDGVWVGTEPSAVLSTEAPAMEKGAAARAALELSQLGVPHPTSWTNWNKPLLAAAKAKTWAAFAKSATSVSIESEGKEVTLVPLCNQGKDGFIEIEDRKIRIRWPRSDQELGEALDRALQAALSAPVPG